MRRAFCANRANEGEGTHLRYEILRCVCIYMQEISTEKSRLLSDPYREAPHTVTIWRNTRSRIRATPPPPPPLQSSIDSLLSLKEGLAYGHRFRCPWEKGLGTERSLRVIIMMMGLIRMQVRCCRDLCSPFADSRANSCLRR